MELKPKYSNQKNIRNHEFAEPASQKPLVLLRDAEGLLRRQTVKTLVPILPLPLAKRIKTASIVAEDSLNQLAEINIDEISDLDLRPARILIGLSFVGFGALAIALLILYLYTLHPELNQLSQIRKYWYQYVWFVSLGVTGMFLLGREAMRPMWKQESVNRTRLH